MPSSPLGEVVRYLRRLGGGEANIVLSDRQLLERFVATHAEEVFAELMHRHGAMVLAVAKRVLGDVHRAEDVFQAAFLILARKAESLQRKDALAAWLSRITYRLALKVHAGAARRQMSKLDDQNVEQEPSQMTELER